MGVQQTSLLAFDEVKSKRNHVYNTILAKAKYLSDFTNMELATLLEWSINRVTPRVFELRHLGYIVQIGKRKCNITKRMCLTWAVKQ